eukprot:TRINITY_DN12558_c4_g1_i4.p1 TRINITY_DN12558_c4_g1~~TRINITY_DN12558_c4_g1_i4.p1  ORF type:complete len:233 (+),score=19.68 TRINITY_DN12558_c4_g1_i4:163-861(+)
MFLLAFNSARNRALQVCQSSCTRSPTIFRAISATAFKVPALRPFTRQMTQLKGHKNASLLSRYSNYLNTNPTATKVITAGFIGLAADLTAQVAIEGTRDLDTQRLLKFVGLQMIIIAPVLHVWYGFLNRRIPGNHLRIVVQRVLLDQLLFAPPFLAFFLSTLSLLEGHSGRISHQLRHDWLPTVIKNWQLWVPAQAINFRFVAPAYQVLFSNMVGLFWTIYLSVVAHQSESS